MCGIIAICSKDTHLPGLVRERFDELVDTMSHRGPDGRGVYSDSRVLLGHRRLAILDLSDGGHQPKVSHNGRFILIFNGEIYNYVEIRETLGRQGCQFQTTSDTEVLLEYFAREGAQCLKTLNGMFAFVIWDSKEDRLFVARDRFGIKPLYYLETEELVAFASEIKALLPLIETVEPNDALIYDFLAHGRVDHLDETFFHNIKRFPAGFCAEVHNGHMLLSKWFDIDSEIAKTRKNPLFAGKSTKEHIDTIRNLFRQSVELRLRSDVPVGSCLSGGIDSSSIVSVVSTILKNEDRRKFQTYSAIYGDCFAKDESMYIEAVLRWTGIKGNFVRPSLSDFVGMFDGFLYHQEEPVTSPSPFTQYCVMKLAHSNRAKVLFDGQGADEILAGYDYMVGYYLAETIFKGRVCAFIRESVAQMRRKNIAGISAAAYQFLPSFLKSALSPKMERFLDQKFAQRFSSRYVVESLLYNSRSLNKALVNHLKFKLQHLLRWEDKSSMAFSIETRVPFLDHQVVAYVLALSSNFKIRNGFTKWVFREAMRSLVPSDILSRTDKIGFAAPEESWLNSQKMELIDRLRQKPHPLLSEYVDLQLLEQFLRARVGRMSLNEVRFVFRIVCLDSWLRIFFSSPYEWPKLEER